MLHYKLINIDLSLILLNATSVTTLALAWFSEHLSSVGGFIVMLSVAVLNCSKAYKEYQKGKNVKENNNEIN